MQGQIASQDRNWAMAAHLSALVALAGMPFGHVIGPLIVYLIKAHESEFVAEHARASLNYQITISVVSLVVVLAAAGVTLGLIATGSTVESTHAGAAVGVLWLCIAFAVVLVLLLSLIFIIAGTIAAGEGRPYNYPFAIRFLR